MKIVNNINSVNGVVTNFIHLNDRSIHYGDGIFETILFCDSKLFYWQQHYQRLLDAANRLNIKCPKEELLLNDIFQLVSKLSSDDLTDEPLSEVSNENNSNSVYAIKLILSRGNGERGYKYSDSISANCFVSISPIDKNYSSIIKQELLSGDLFICKTQVSINESLAGIKHLNRLENVIASNELKTRSKDINIIDGLMMNANKHVIECTSSNIFAIKNNQLITPKLNLSGIRGIMRYQIIKLAKQCNIDVAECNLKSEELLQADSLFITNSLIGMKSINAINETCFTQSSVVETLFVKLLETNGKYVKKI